MAGAPQIVVLGAGSVGCFIGGAWQSAGCRMSFIGREAIGKEIAGRGITLSDYSGWRTHLPPDTVNFGTRPAALKKADLILLCVKSNATEAAAREIARHGKSEAAVISFQNGIDNAATLKRILPGRQVIQGMVSYNVAHLGEGRWHKATSGNLIAEENDLTRRLSDQVGGGPAGLMLAKDMASLAWGKLLINLNNAVNALSGKPLLEQLAERDYRRVVAASIIETIELLKAAGIEPAKIGPVPPRLLPHAIAAPDFIFRNLFLRVQKIDAQARSSMYDDLAAGRATEIDHLNGEVIKLARSLGRDAPVNNAIVQLIKEREMGIERTWSAANLRRHILEGYKAAAIFGY